MITEQKIIVKDQEYTIPTEIKRKAERNTVVHGLSMTKGLDREIEDYLFESQKFASRSDFYRAACAFYLHFELIKPMLKDDLRDLLETIK